MTQHYCLPLKQIFDLNSIYFVPQKKHLPCCLVNDNTGGSKLTNMDSEKMEQRSKHKKKEKNQRHDRHGKITKKTLPLYFFPPFTSGRFPVVDDASKYKVAMKTTDLRKETRLGDKHMSFPSSFRSYREELLHSYQQDTKRLNSNKKKTLVTAKGLKRPLLLPPLPVRTFPGKKAKQANGFPSAVKTTSNGQKMLPRYLPKIEARKAEVKDIDLDTPGTTNSEKIENQKLLPPLAKRTVKPLRAAISSSATQRGLVTLDLEEHFILRFRLSNYDVKDINVATLNEPV